MYKVAKSTLVNLNTTKIYLLRTRKNKYCIEVKIVFSIDKTDNYFSVYLKDTLKFTTPDTYFFKLDDYLQYLADNYEYDLTEKKDPCVFTNIEGTSFSTMYLTPSPFTNLVQQQVKDIVQYNNAKLQYSAITGLFTYHDFVDNTNTTRGILKDLRRLQQGKEVNTNTTDECWLYKAIKTLDLHWN